MKKAKMEAYRKLAIYEMLLKHTQSEVAKAFRLTQATISNIQREIEADAREKLRKHVQERIPYIHLSTMDGIDLIISKCWEIIDNPKNGNQYLRIHSFQILLQCYQARQQLTSDSAVVNESLNLIEQSKHKLEQLERGVLPKHGIDLSESTLEVPDMQSSEDEELEDAITTSDNQILVNANTHEDNVDSSSRDNDNDNVDSNKEDWYLHTSEERDIDKDIEDIEANTKNEAEDTSVKSTRVLLLGSEIGKAIGDNDDHDRDRDNHDKPRDGKPAGNNNPSEGLHMEGEHNHATIPTATILPDQQQQSHQQAQAQPASQHASKAEGDHVEDTGSPEEVRKEQESHSEG